MGRSILHCDMNNFYASVECMLNPSLRDKPVAVGGSAEDRHGIVLAKNNLAKASGIITAETLWQARRKCPDLIIVPPTFKEYHKYSKLAQQIYGRFTDQVEPFGLDECWLDVTGSKIFGDAAQIAEQIRASIKDELGLTVSIGVSFNKIFAKLGSDLKKPDAVTIISEEGFKQQIWPLPVGELLGVGKATQKTLAIYGISTIGQLAAASSNLLEACLGKNGVLLKRYAAGLDDAPVAWADAAPDIKSVGRGITTVADLEDNQEAWCVILELVQEIGTQLRKQGKKAGGVALSIRNNQLATKEWQMQLARPSFIAQHLAKAAYELLIKHYSWQYPIRTLTVRAINLVDQDMPQQLDLFTDPQEDFRADKLNDVIENIRERYGKNIIRNAILVKDIKMPKQRDNERILHEDEKN